DLLDGTSIQLQSVDSKWVAAEGGGGDQLRANRDAASAWETFFLRRADHGAFFIRAGSGHFWSVDAASGEVFANKEDEEEGEMFWVRHKLGEEGTVQLRAANGNWVQALDDGRLIADIDEDAPRWDTTCTFTLSKLADMGGEAQLMLALGREEAERRLQQHREEWVGEGDFEWLARQGMNAVRIPVGWWVAVDPTPEEFVEGALELLDKALDWAHTHSIRVIVCLHAAPGSQNGWEHSASRDGIPMWGKPGTPYMDETVDAVRFLVQRYASHPAFAGLEPINEPRADAVSFDDLARYYERCYAVLREHSPSAYFVISGRIFANEREWDDFMTSAQYTNVIYDAHWYQVHDHAEFGSQSVDFNLQYPSKQRAAALSLLERGQRLVFVGEWSLALLCDTSDNINSRFAKAQLQAYLASSSGSFFWSLKHGQGWDPWSFKASVERRWMTSALWPCISVSPNISLNSEVLQQEKPQQQLQQQQRLVQRLPRDPAKVTKPAVSASERLSENANRLHDLLLQLSTAQTFDEKDAILSADPRVRAVFPQQGSSLGKFVKPAVSMAVDCCSQEELYLLKCLVASGQEHLLDTPVAWAEGLDTIWEKAHYQSSAKAESGGGGVKEAFSMLASIIDGWDTHPDAPRSALPAFLAGFDNPGVFPAPLMDLIDWEDRRSARSLGGKGQEEPPSSLFAQFMEGLEYPSVFGAPLLDLVDWERQWQSDDGASSPTTTSSSNNTSSRGSGGDIDSSSGFASDGGSSSSGWEDNDGSLREQEPRVQLQSLLAMLRRVEKFYDGIGGILGYQSTCLDLIQQSVAASQQAAAASSAAAAAAAEHAVAVAAATTAVPATSPAAEKTNSLANEGENERPGFESQRRIFMPPGQDLASDPEFASQAAFWGLEGLPAMAEIYPLGGAGDRLGLVDEATGESLPVAMLPYCGRTLLHGLLRDLEAREYLHFRVFGEQHVTPVAIMTSAAKKNHQRVLALLQQHNWFGRGEHNFRLFQQPLVPTVAAEDGRWLASGPLSPVLKPGGHGVIWKLAADEGVFDWLRSKGRKAAVIRQISNPLAATDMTLLALSGVGLHGNKKFGFASCDRNVGTAEGVNVLAEQQQADGSWAYGLTCIEYTEFEKLGISDAPVAPGSSRSKYPANTNVLFADLHAVEMAVLGKTAVRGVTGVAGANEEQQRQQRQEQQQPCCGPALNSSSSSSNGISSSNGSSSSSNGSSSSSNGSSSNSNGSSSANFPGDRSGGGRLECTMQNIADLLVTSLPYRLPLDSDAAATAASSISPTHSLDATAQEGREGRGGAQVQGERSATAVDSGTEGNAAEHSKHQLQAVLDTFLVYNDRRKVTSSAKRRRKPTDTSLHQTPDGSFLDLNRNSLELFSSCGVAMPHMHSDHKRYVDSSPPFIFLFHPALGPLWSVIRQKVQGGSVAPQSEVKLEIAELVWSNVHVSGPSPTSAPTHHLDPQTGTTQLGHSMSCEVVFLVNSESPLVFLLPPSTLPSPMQVSGSLLIEADAVTGSMDTQFRTTQLCQGCGRCQLHNVTVTNRGVDWESRANVYWQDRVQRKEALRVVLRGDAEFEARDVAIVGDHVFDVPEGHRMVVFASETGAMQTRLEKLPGRRPTWEWQYSVGDHGSLQLTLVEKP
ncbi:unnamed protein product, partial [Closterium sp. NIES-53]